jgi:2-dehydro-3-deoxyphosphogluconate aldolase/(4S)-4-hydroxy-2-oxoglutarate aldolase
MGPKPAIDAIMQLSPVMPVVTIDDAALAVDLARALVKGGIRVIEVTLRTESALRAIANIARDVPEICVGAGTVLNVSDLQAATKAGAAFAISPGATAELLAAGRSSAIPYLPAIATASELMTGLAAGYRHFKFFPAAVAGGVAALKALHGPFPDARFCPTGGVTPSNAGSYLELPNVLCVGGSWITPLDLQAARDWGQIESLARAALAGCTAAATRRR